MGTALQIHEVSLSGPESYYRARYYDESTGRFISEDAIRFEAGNDFYSYTLSNPVNNTDPSGLDVVVCYYPYSGGDLGHTGFGFPGDPFTVGFYPAGRGLHRIHGPGELRPDVGDGPKLCKLIHTTPAQDACMLQKRIERLRNPGIYSAPTRQCTSFVRDSLKECDIPAGPYKGPSPELFFDNLPGTQMNNIPPKPH